MLTLRRAGVSDARVLAAFDRCARADFLDPLYAGLAPEDVPIPLPCGQISIKPSALALMIEALQVGPSHRVLLAGAGSGYSAALLAALAAEVEGLERFHTLRNAAADNLVRAGFSNAQVILADALAHQPVQLFDRILIAGAVDAPPPGLLAGLAPGGIMAAPLRRGSDTRVTAIRKTGADAIESRDMFALDVPPLEPGLAQRL